MNSDLISRSAAIEQCKRHSDYTAWSIETGIEAITAVDAVDVAHGRWVLEVRSFYRDTWDESCELVVYILASCGECNCKHPNNDTVFLKTLYAPEDAYDNFRFDQEAECKKALAEFIQRGYNFANYCPNCGAKMDGEVANISQKIYNKERNKSHEAAKG